MHLDNTDRKILKLLQHDGRMTNQELATKCNISTSACHERFKRLREDGYIIGFSAVLDPAKLDKAITIYALVMLDTSAKAIAEDFAVAANKTPEIMECYMIVGAYDYLVRVQVRDLDSYRIFLGNTLSQMPGVREIKTCTVLEQIKYTTRLPI